MLAFLPVVYLMFRGEAIRERLSAPSSVNVFDTGAGTERAEAEMEEVI